MNTRTHGILDYLVSVLVALSPWLFRFAAGGPETWVPVVVGVAGLAYSAITNYEMGLSRVLPMSTHLILDVASGLFLAVSPWLFGFAHLVYMPHLAFGLFEIAAAALTRKAASAAAA